MLAGSCGSSTRRSGTGSSQGTSVCSTSGASGSVAGAPRPVGIGLRLRPSSADRQAFVAMRCSHVRIEARPSNPW